MPDMSDVLDEYAQTILIKEITTTTVDFEPTETIVATVIEAVVQVADTEKIQVSDIDYSKEYIQVHSTYQMEINEIIEWLGKDYKIRSKKNYSQYGYTEAIGEEIK